MTHASTEARARAQFLFTTTDMSQVDIAAEVGVWDRTVNRWIKQGKWERASGGTERPPKISAALHAPVQRLFESGACVADVALLLDCDKGYVYSYAHKCGWTRPAAPKPVAPGKSDEAASVEAVLRDPAAAKSDVIRALERAIALTGADVLGGDPRASGRVTALARLTELARTMAADAPAHDAQEDSSTTARSWKPSPGDSKPSTRPRESGRGSATRRSTGAGRATGGRRSTSMRGREARSPSPQGRAGLGFRAKREPSPAECSRMPLRGRPHLARAPTRPSPPSPEGEGAAAQPCISAVTCAATDWERPSRL